MKIWFSISKILSNTTWESFRKKISGRKYDLSQENLKDIKTLLAKNYYVILINRKSHFTTYGIGFISFLKTGKWPKYSHSLMNVDNVTDENKSEEYMFMEATIEGVHWSPFNKIFNCDNVYILLLGGIVNRKF